jgi:hypothetical protein
MGAYHRGVHVLVTNKLLIGTHIVTGFKQVCRKAVGFISGKGQDAAASETVQSAQGIVFDA